MSPIIHLYTQLYFDGPHEVCLRLSIYTSTASWIHDTVSWINDPGHMILDPGNPFLIV